MKQFKLIILSAAALFVAGLREQFCTANVESAAGTHAGPLTRRADGAITPRHCLVKKGSDDFHVALCGASDYPTGICDDEASAAEDIVAIWPLGSTGGKGTRKIRVASALSDEIDLYTAANGLAQAEPGSAGTYWKIGRTVGDAVQVGSSDYEIEFAPQQPVKLTVAATPSTVGNIAAAFATPGLVKFL